MAFEAQRLAVVDVVCQLRMFVQMLDVVRDLGRNRQAVLVNTPVLPALLAFVPRSLLHLVAPCPVSRLVVVLDLRRTTTPLVKEK